MITGDDMSQQLNKKDAVLQTKGNEIREWNAHFNSIVEYL